MLNPFPPNILIFSENEYVFKRYQTLLNSIVERDSYVVYPITSETMKTSRAWQSSTKLLVLASDWKKYVDCVQHFLSKGGGCLSFHPLDLEETTLIENGATMYRKNGGMLISTCKTESSKHIAFLLERYFSIKIAAKTINEESKCVNHIAYVVAEPFHEEALIRNFMSDCSAPTVISFSLKLPVYNNQPNETIEVLRLNTENLKFSRDEYFDVLKTKTLGKVCFYFDVVHSTHSVVESFTSLPNGLVAIAKRQTRGRGRSGNVWLSPEGCAMFSFRILFPLQSEMGRHLSLLQHMASLAVVLAIKEVNKNASIGVKWPNDIYFKNQSNHSLIKLGGILATSSITGSEIAAAIGIGVNLNNRHPTVCLNEILEDLGSKPLTLERFMALVLNQMEYLVDSMQAFKIGLVLDLYHAHWLHDNAEVSINNGETTVSALVVGIDNYGFLRVKLKNCGELVTVHPDGNSFDMLNGLLIPKFQK